ncbi:MAG: DUF177 domain-containing protein [Alistipes sp.]
MDATKKYSIPYKGLKNGTHLFDFAVDGTLFKAFDNTDIKGCCCDAKVALIRSETWLELATTITGDVVVECDRCLEDCRVPVNYEGVLTVKFSNEICDYDGQIMWLSPAESQVDLAQYIYESIVLSLPYQRVHPEGECNAEMLEHFKVVSDEEFAAIEAAAHQEEEQQGALRKLAELKVKMETEK